MEVQVNLLKKQLVLAQQACFLSLIQLEKDRNPHGTNDNHRYEDLRGELAKSAEQQTKDALLELQKVTIFHCKS